MLKFIVLAALADPEGSRTKRVLLALFDAATLGTISQAPVQAAGGLHRVFHLPALPGCRRDAAARRVQKPVAGNRSLAILN